MSFADLEFGDKIKVKKHAYLIMAHNQYEILQTTISLLDHEQNTFFIHIDKKSKDNPVQEIQSTAKKSTIVFMERTSVNWGGYSTIKCVINLLKEALKGDYDYYHLLSGVDIPLKTKTEILDFFEKQKDREYIHFEQEQIQEKYLKRVQTYYWFQEYAKRNRFIHIMGRIFTKIQTLMGIDRVSKQTFEFQFGALWFSITKSLAQYVVKKEKWIEQNFKYTCCADELFIQTLVINTEFKKKLPEKAFTKDGYISCLRHIDWKRGNPYVFRDDDFDELITSNCLFARKFDITKDKVIIERLKLYLDEEKGNI